MSKLKRWVKATVLALAASMFLTVMPAVPQAKIEAHAEGVKGIDVSGFQGNIDWNAVAASGVKYAMVRIGNTAYGPDSKFAQNVVGATNAGIRVGGYVYTYATNAEQAAADAAFAIAMMANVPMSFPIAIDIEDTVHKSLTPAQQQEIVNTFNTMIYAAGYHPMVYASKNWYLERLGHTAWDQWVAQYADHCDYPYPYVMWQATSKGSVPGIAGNVDVDYLYKDYFSIIQPNGFVDLGGKTYYFVNWRKQFGLQAVNGLQYVFDGTGAMIKNVTQTDEAGNILRYCNDGHLVVITIQAQQAAAAAKAQLDYANAVLAQANAAYQAAQVTLQETLAASANFQAAAAEAQQQAAAYMALFQQLPTTENQQAAAIAQAQYDQAMAVATQAQANATAAQAATDQAANAVVAATATADAAKVTNDAAQAAIVIPQ